MHLIFLEMRNFLLEEECFLSGKDRKKVPFGTTLCNIQSKEGGNRKVCFFSSSSKQNKQHCKKENQKG